MNPLLIQIFKRQHPKIYNSNLCSDHFLDVLKLRRIIRDSKYDIRISYFESKISTEPWVLGFRWDGLQIIRHILSFYRTFIDWRSSLGEQTTKKSIWTVLLYFLKAYLFFLIRYNSTENIYANLSNLGCI